MTRRHPSRNERFHSAAHAQRFALPSLLMPALACGLLLSVWKADAQVNGVGQLPYRGWSTFSDQTINNNFLTQANIQTESDALRDSGLQQHGFEYINIDSGWMGSFDANGRPIPNTATFPDIKALADHIHSNSQKVGIASEHQVRFCEVSLL